MFSFYNIIFVSLDYVRVPENNNEQMNFTFSVVGRYVYIFESILNNILNLFLTLRVLTDTPSSTQ